MPCWRHNSMIESLLTSEGSFLKPPSALPPTVRQKPSHHVPLWILLLSLGGNLRFQSCRSEKESMLRQGFFHPHSAPVNQSNPYHQANESTEQHGEDPDSKHAKSSKQSQTKDHGEELFNVIGLSSLGHRACRGGDARSGRVSRALGCRVRATGSGMTRPTSAVRTRARVASGLSTVLLVWLTRARRM